MHIVTIARSVSDGAVLRVVRRGAVYITLVEHPARMECGTEVAATEFRPSYRREAVLQACRTPLWGDSWEHLRWQSFPLRFWPSGRPTPRCSRWGLRVVRSTLSMFSLVSFEFDIQE